VSVKTARVLYTKASVKTASNNNSGGSSKAGKGRGRARGSLRKRKRGSTVHILPAKT
jgi:hypothetical protein